MGINANRQNFTVWDTDILKPPREAGGKNWADATMNESVSVRGITWHLPLRSNRANRVHRDPGRSVARTCRSS